MIRAVLDAGVLIAGLISSSGAPAGLLDAVTDGQFDLVVCPTLLAEIRRALSYPKLQRYVTVDEADAFIAWIARTAVVLADPSEIPVVTRDRDDDYLFAVGVAAEADVVVSGDSDVTSAPTPPVPVATPREFLEALRTRS